jgi:hypothetical protein
MNALTLKGFLGISTSASFVSAIGICLYCGLREHLDLEEVALISIGSVVIGLTVAAWSYLIQVAKDIRTLRLASENLLPCERVVMERLGCHFPAGWPLKFWKSVGWKLILTSHRLAFLTHRGQPWHYRLFFPLEQIAKADTRGLFGGIPGCCLRLTTAEGKQELFNFGAIHENLEAERWVGEYSIRRVRRYSWTGRFGAHFILVDRSLENTLAGSLRVMDSRLA